VAAKAVLHGLAWEPLEFSPLLTGVIAAEVFIIGFLLSGTAADFKEAERLPGEIAASLETMADECLITAADEHLPAARQCLAQLADVARAIRSWLAADRGLDDVLTDLRGLNEPFRVFAPKIQPGFTTRLKSEQAAIRAKVLRIDTMRRTSYVAAGYLIGEITGSLIIVVLLVSKLGAPAPTLALLGIISFLLRYLFELIRELDNPFEYPNGKQGPADVPLDVLERTEDRLRVLLTSVPAPPLVIEAAHDAAEG
jgi:hypothetical protein